MYFIYYLLLFIYISAEEPYVVCDINDVSKYEDIDPSEGYEDYEVINFDNSKYRVHLSAI